MNKTRIGYLDALRGFTMILVVYSHVISFTFQGVSGFSFNDIFVTFRMPLFFFLSGFLMFKPGRFRNGKDTMTFLKNKFKVQLIPTLIFTVIFCLVFRYSFGDLWFEKAKCGYWFTLTLFYFFTIYALGDYVLGRFLKGKTKWAVGAMVSLLIYAFSKYSISPACPWADSFLCGFIGYANLQFFLFFFMGATIKAHFDQFQALLDRKNVMFWLIVCFITLECIIQLPQSRDWIISALSFSAYSLIKTLAGILGVVAIFAYFREYHHFFENTAVGTSLQYIGQRTLDIYLIHLLLIRTDMGFAGEFLLRYHNPISELFLGMAASMLIIGICLVLSSFLRTSDVLAKLLFGKVLK